MTIIKIIRIWQQYQYWERFLNSWMNLTEVSSMKYNCKWNTLTLTAANKEEIGRVGHLSWDEIWDWPCHWRSLSVLKPLRQSWQEDDPGGWVSRRSSRRSAVNSQERVGQEVGGRSSEARSRSATCPTTPSTSTPSSLDPGQLDLELPQLVSWLLSPEPRHSDQPEVVRGEVRDLLDHGGHPRQSANQDLTTHPEHCCKERDVITLDQSGRGEAGGEMSTFDWDGQQTRHVWTDLSQLY